MKKVMLVNDKDRCVLHVIPLGDEECEGTSSIEIEITVDKPSKLKHIDNYGKRILSVLTGDNDYKINSSFFNKKTDRSIEFISMVNNIGILDYSKKIVLSKMYKDGLFDEYFNTMLEMVENSRDELLNKFKIRNKNISYISLCDKIKKHEKIISQINSLKIKDNKYLTDENVRLSPMVLMSFIYFNYSSFCNKRETNPKHYIDCIFNIDIEKVKKDKYILQCLLKHSSKVSSNPVELTMSLYRELIFDTKVHRSIVRSILWKLKDLIELFKMTELEQAKKDLFNVLELNQDEYVSLEQVEQVLGAIRYTWFFLFPLDHIHNETLMENLINKTYYSQDEIDTFFK